jgi:hypothetical protein
MVTDSASVERPAPILAISPTKVKLHCSSRNRRWTSAGGHRFGWSRGFQVTTRYRKRTAIRAPATELVSGAGFMRSSAA